MRGTLKNIEVGCRGGVHARRYQAGSLRPLQDLHKSHKALWTRLRSVFVCSHLTYTLPRR